MPHAGPEDVATAVVSVADLNRRAREFIEAGFPLLWVAGEISNFTRAASGHCYFSLKDAAAQVRCVYFRHKSALLDWKPENGMQVEVRAVPTLYEARGEFQLTVETMRRSGAGALYAAFARLKAKLEQEGLFEPSRRRPLPAFPRSVGVVTSPQAAALRDVLTTLARRMPSLRVVIYPTPVQGEGAAEKIARAVHAASERAEVDVLIVCRGGGSIEDLWAFNEEVVARALAGCAIPVVSGVGHETDFTIADFVADARAPTPTAAAELISPRRDELLARLGALGARLAREMGRGLGARMQHLDHLGKRLVHPGARIAGEARQLAQLAGRLRAAAAHATRAWTWRLGGLAQRLSGAPPDVGSRAARLGQLRLDLRRTMARELERRAAALSGVAAHLAHLNPQSVLERGYSIAQAADGSIVRAADALTAGAALRLTFARGAANARVENIEIPQE